MITEQKQKFIQDLALHGNVSEAAKTALVSRSSLYRYRAANPEFAKAWDAAREQATDNLADEAMRRAINGVEEVRYFKGEPVGTVRKYSDQLLMFLLRAYRPQVFGSKQTNELSDGGDDEYDREDLVEKMETLTEPNEK